MNNNIFNKFQETLITNGIIIPEEHLGDYPDLIVDRLDSIHEWGYITRQIYTICDDMVHFYTHDHKLIASLWLDACSYRIDSEHILHIKSYNGNSSYNLMRGAPIDDTYRIYIKDGEYNVRPDEYMFVYEDKFYCTTDVGEDEIKAINTTLKDIENDGFYEVTEDIHLTPFIKDAIPLRNGIVMNSIK